MTHIDSLQEEVDNFRTKVSNINYEITKCKQETAKARKIRNAVNAEPYKKKTKKLVDESVFTGEHLDYLREKRNLVSDLTEQINQIQSATSPIEESVQDLQQQGAFLMCEQSNTKKKLQDVRSQQKKANEDTFIIKAQLKEIEIDISNHERLRKDIETSVVGLTARKNAIEEKAGDKGDLQQSIASLEAQISMLSVTNSQLQQDLDNGSQQYENDLQNIGGKLSTIQNKINWSSEQNNLRVQLKNVQQQLSDTRKERDEIFNMNTEIESRLNKLVPIINRWAPSFRGQPVPENDDEDIDDVLIQCSRRVNGNKRTVVKNNTSLENLINENSKLEAKIARKQEELSRQMTCFLSDQYRLKNNIQNHRTGSFEEEHKIIEQMNRLKLKLARISQK
ncbi:hypothetical protein TRFO_10846 [Tritrichomonas foetus]|uniref:Uncharacterized protein n=1 Tax=Tritrichomonas foetus TaxID=1144522 RepID=A0A1J4JB64_9EUKA|nr:hypothetical protein TRFO_10846 [Tritrichomonas foetus]|eukprot:OHS94899.1 hypothetical protein TRFO_10846 [Tritrichomonas foetus]